MLDMVGRDQRHGVFEVSHLAILGESAAFRDCNSFRQTHHSIEMATTRLRKTFRYPADGSDDDETPKDLDEQGQSFHYGGYMLATDTD